MQIFVSTTFNDDTADLDFLLGELKKLDIDGVEIGSTHKYKQNYVEIIKKCWQGRLVTHNFFPPSKDPNFFVNIASEDLDHRLESVKFAKNCLQTANLLGAEIYTIHPGFLANPQSSSLKGSDNYDMQFSNQRVSRKRAFSNMSKSLEDLILFSQDLEVKLAIETEGSATKPGISLMEDYSEYEELFSIFGDSIKLNLNLAHTSFAAKIYNYSLSDFIDAFYNWIIAAEISHNDGLSDQHASLIEDSYVFDHLNKLPDIPLILEFRNASMLDIKASIFLMRRHQNKD